MASETATKKGIELIPFLFVNEKRGYRSPVSVFQA